MKKGFTIVETLVAITVLMIAIAGPLVVASKGLTSAIYSKDQMIASFLAQESMEVLKNTRDNNIAGSLAWLGQIDGSGNCYNTFACDSGGIGSTFKTDCTALVGCTIYQDDDGYNHDNSGNPTIFKRYYYLVDKVSTTQEVQANVIVNWNEGTIPYQIKLTSELVNTVR